MISFFLELRALEYDAVPLAANPREPHWGSSINT
jgi:hypothetical protein